MAATKMGSFRHGSFLDRSKEPLLAPRKSHCDFTLNSPPSSISGVQYHCFQSVSAKLRNLSNSLQDDIAKLWEMGRSDPRKAIFAAKMGLSLALVCLVIFFKEPLRNVSQYSIWAILTVVVVFEFTIGATLNKGFNRALGTHSVGGLALGIAELSTLTGVFQEAVIIISTFIAGCCGSYVKLYPAMKNYEYGFRVFLLTYCIVMVSGSTSTFLDMALYRLVFDSCWSWKKFGREFSHIPDLGRRGVPQAGCENFKGVATSLEECVSNYLQCKGYERIPSKILTFQASDDPVYSGYRPAVQSATQEDSLVEFAIWEPPHGP